jgi:hypothetical protein
MCCASQKIPIVKVPRAYSVHSRWDDSRPKDNVPRDIYGKPLGNFTRNNSLADNSSRAQKKILDKQAEN